MLILVSIKSMWREPRIVEKQAIPFLKALIVGILNPEDWGRGFVIGLPRPLFVKNLPFRRRGRGKLLSREASGQHL